MRLDAVCVLVLVCRDVCVLVWMVCRDVCVLVLVGSAWLDAWADESQAWNLAAAGVRMMICGREHRVSIFLLLFCIVGSVGLMHVAVMFVCWLVSTVLLDFLVVVLFSCCLH